MKKCVAVQSLPVAVIFFSYSSGVALEGSVSLLVHHFSQGLGF